LVALVALAAPLFVALGSSGYGSSRKVYIAWSLFEYSFYS